MEKFMGKMKEGKSKLGVDLRQNLMDFFFENNLFILAGKIWLWISVCFGVVGVFYLYQGLFYKSLFCLGCILICLFFRNHVLVKQTQMELRKYGKQYNV